jgi:hypothetical protein
MMRYITKGTGFWIVGACLMLFIQGCTADELEEPLPGADCDLIEVSYDLNIKALIDRSCAYNGCHLDSAPGRYTSYEGLLDDLQGGKFEQRVITLRSDLILGMPPNNAPEGRPKDLSEEELNLIRCWLDKGFPEK